MRSNQHRPMLQHRAPTSHIPERSKCRPVAEPLYPTPCQTTTLRPSDDPTLSPRGFAKRVSYPSRMTRIQRRCSSTYTPYGILRRRWESGRHHCQNGLGSGGMGIGEGGRMFSRSGRIALTDGSPGWAHASFHPSGMSQVDPQPRFR